MIFYKLYIKNMKNIKSYYNWSLNEAKSEFKLPTADINQNADIFFCGENKTLIYDFFKELLNNINQEIKSDDPQYIDFWVKYKPGDKSVSYVYKFGTSLNKELKQWNAAVEDDNPEEESWIERLSKEKYHEWIIILYIPADTIVKLNTGEWDLSNPEVIKNVKKQCTMQLLDGLDRDDVKINYSDSIKGKIQKWLKGGATHQPFASRIGVESGWQARRIRDKKFKVDLKDLGKKPTFIDKFKDFITPDQHHAKTIGGYMADKPTYTRARRPERWSTK